MNYEVRESDEEVSDLPGLQESPRKSSSEDAIMARDAISEQLQCGAGFRETVG